MIPEIRFSSGFDGLKLLKAIGYVYVACHIHRQKVQNMP